MKRLYILLLFILVQIAVARAQEFRLVIHDTARTGVPGSEIVCDGYIKNLKYDSIKVIMIRQTNDIPNGWMSSLCFEFCAAPFWDTLETVIAPADSQDFSIHFYTDSTPATGSAWLLFRNPDSSTAERHLFSGSTDASAGPKPDRGRIQDFFLAQNQPNPFSKQTLFRLQMPGPGFATLEIYDVLGRRLYQESLRPTDGSEARFTWLGQNQAGAMLPSGTYFYRVRISGSKILWQSEIKKLTLIR